MLRRMVAVRIVVGVVGALVAAGTMGSAIRTVVVPRGEQAFLARLVVLPLRRTVNFAAHTRKDPVKQEAMKARLGPIALMTFPFAPMRKISSASPSPKAVRALPSGSSRQV